MPPSGQYVWSPFFGMLRKSHLLASSTRSFVPSQQFLRSDFQFLPWGVLIDIQWGKTIQFRERVVQLPLPLIPGSPLCPVTAIRRVFSFVQNPPLQSQAFMWVDPTSLAYKVFTYSRFLRCLQNILQALGLPAKDFASHSFRWSGASFAFSAGLPVELIKILGDWHSDAVLLYLTVPLSVRLESVNVIANTILSTV